MADSDNLSQLVGNIEKKEIILPDFQRKFVWTDEDKQRNLVASVLAKMPIGSILLLESNPDEYSSKIIGSRVTIDASGLHGTVKYLLDGQQRITVLTNVFSNVIHEQVSTVSELVSTSLKRRFFLRLPKWNDKMVYDPENLEQKDLFGIGKLRVPMTDPLADPDFLSSDIKPYIEIIPFTQKDKTPYNPKTPLSAQLDDFCRSYPDGYLIPLYLLIPPKTKPGGAVLSRRKTLMESIAGRIAADIIDYFVDITDLATGKEFIEKVVDDYGLAKGFCDAYDKEFMCKGGEGVILGEEFQNYVKTDLANEWISVMNNYLDSCLSHIYLNVIQVEAKNRARAIDIYENLNLGGVSLSTFDLIMAKVAKVSQENFGDRMRDAMKEEKSYPEPLLPHDLMWIYKATEKKRKINASIDMGCYIEKDDTINPKYLDAFLNVISLYCNNPKFEAGKYKVDMIKRGKILMLSADQINDNCKRVWEALDRALFFLHTRCGIRTIRDMNYNLMLVVVATLFMKDNYYLNKNCHDKLEGWYWSSVFSGTFDKDQNSIMIADLNNLVDFFEGNKDSAWLVARKARILNADYFSEKDFLLMQKADEERIPKGVMQDFLCQYMLSETYPDLLDPTRIMSVFSPDAGQLEAHHLIPLGSMKTVGQISKELRKDPKNVYNSPLNFVLISKDTNKKISDSPLNDYVKDLCPEAKSSLAIDTYTVEESKDKDKFLGVLRKRFDHLQGDIMKEVNNLLC